MTSIALYSAQPILAEGFRDVVAGIEGFALLSVYASPDLPINRIQGIGCPDVLVVDVGRVTGALTLGGLIRLRSAAGTAAIVLRIESVAPEYAAQALELGVRGFILRTASLESHRECLRRVANGELWIQDEIRSELLRIKETKLSRRERQLMALLAQGLKNKEIAWQMKITVGTVKLYLSRLFRKVEVNDRFELALLALRSLTPDQTGGVELINSTDGPSNCQSSLHPLCFGTGCHCATGRLFNDALD
jgi:two-component system response regulator DegU